MLTFCTTVLLSELAAFSPTTPAEVEPSGPVLRAVLLDPLVPPGRRPAARTPPMTAVVTVRLGCSAVTTPESGTRTARGVLPCAAAALFTEAPNASPPTLFCA